MELNKPAFLKLSHDEQKNALEAIIFASDEALSANALYKLLIIREINNNGSKTNIENDNPGDEDLFQETIEKEIKEKFNVSPEFFDDLVVEINDDLTEFGRPYNIVLFAGGYQFATRSEYGELVQILLRSKSRRRLSQAALECLAIIAYKQPVTKPEIDQIRGVTSSEVVNSLVDKNLVRIPGRRKSLGKPLLYATTKDFLRAFGLNGLKDLPQLKEFDDMGDNGGISGVKGEEIILTVNSEEEEKALRQMHIGDSIDTVIEIEDDDVEEKIDESENNITD